MVQPVIISAYRKEMGGVSSPSQSEQRIVREEYSSSRIDEEEATPTHILQ